MAVGTVAAALLVVVNARAGGDRGSGTVEVACCGQVPNVDGHWQMVVGGLPRPGQGFRIVCKPGAPLDCYHTIQWWPGAPGKVFGIPLAPSLRDLQATFGTLGGGGGGTAGLINVNSQLMLVNNPPAGGETGNGKNSYEVTIDEMIEAFNIDPKSIVVPIKKGARLGTAPQICWGADSGGTIVEMPGKTGCLFPAQLLTCTKASQAHDDRLMQVTARANAILSKVAASNRDPNVKLAILMVRGRPALAWVSRERPKSRPTIGPESPWEQVKATLHIAE